jgi:gas vesicle protein
MASDRNDNGLAFFLTGLALGAIAGILLAPDSGRETRGRILSEARHLRLKATEEFEEGLEHLRTDLPEARKRYSEAVREGWKTFLAVLEKDHESPPASES